MSTQAVSSWPKPVRALANKDFRFYFFGQAVSHLGKWIQQVALSWLIYHLTGSASLLGVATFAALIPQLVLGPVAGAWTDKHDKRRLLIIVLAVLGIQSLALSAMTASHVITPTIIIVMSLILGVLNSFENPLRQAMISSFIGNKQDLPNGLALNAMLLNGSRFAGPPLAGLLVATVGEAACFAINSLAFVAPLITLFVIPGRPGVRVMRPLGDIFQEGFVYVTRNPTIKLLMLCVIAVNITASSYVVLLPILAKNVFLGDAKTLGYLWGAAGIGAFGATIFLSFQSGIRRHPWIVMCSIFISAVGLVGSALSTQIAPCIFFLVLVGFGISATNVSTNILLQSLAAEELRGRIVSFYISIRFGFEAIGGLLAGWLVAASGTQAALIVEGILLTVAGVLILRRRARLLL